MSKRIQFSIRRLMAVILCTGLGLSALLQADGVLLFEWILLLTIAGATFGAAVGLLLYRTWRFAFVGCCLGTAFALWAWAI